MKRDIQAAALQSATARRVEMTATTEKVNLETSLEGPHQNCRVGKVKSQLGPAVQFLFLYFLSITVHLVLPLAKKKDVKSYINRTRK